MQEGRPARGGGGLLEIRLAATRSEDDRPVVGGLDPQPGARLPSDAIANGFADAFAVATARLEHGTILTGDPESLALPREVVRVVKLERCLPLQSSDRPAKTGAALQAHQPVSEVR